MLRGCSAWAMVYAGWVNFVARCAFAALVLFAAHLLKRPFARSAIGQGRVVRCVALATLWNLAVVRIFGTARGLSVSTRCVCHCARLRADERAKCSLPPFPLPRRAQVPPSFV
eukprot:3763998-Alexandrium_andersonii.AAC.1